jgi:hypothetical protein
MARRTTNRSATPAAQRGKQHRSVPRVDPYHVDLLPRTGGFVHELSLQVPKGTRFRFRIGGAALGIERRRDLP